MMKIFQLLTLLLAGRGVAATQNGVDILDIAKDTDGFSTLVVALEASGLAFLFDQNFFCTNFGLFCRDYTVFAPTDDAFDALGESTLERLLDEDYAPHLKDILLYHAVSGEVFSGDIKDGAEVKTLNHETVTAGGGDGVQLQLNGDANVVSADIDASNGVVHAIDRVMLPRSANDIATIAADDGSFSILLSLLDRVGLVDFVKTADKLTVFAPTDDAFDGVDTGALTDDQVEDILTYHVVQDEVLTKFELLKSRRDGVTTVQGGTIDVGLVGRWWNKELKLNNDVGILISDVLASNGIIHAIDSVLIPPS